MIDPLKNISLSFLNNPQQPPVKFFSPSNKDTLVSARGKSQFKENILAFLSKVFEWIKTHLFSWCFDDKEEKQKKQLDQINQYIDLYFSLAKESGNVEYKSLREKFKQLDSEVRELVQYQIIDILKEAAPEKSDSFYQRKMQAVVNNPFVIIVDEKKSEEDKKIQVMGLAILHAREKIAGF